MTTFALIAFWTSLALLAYVAAGYQLLLGLGKWFVRRRPVAAAGELPAVSLIIPAYNEEAVIEDKLLNSLNLDYPKDRLHILVASDGSSDATVAIARRFETQGVEVMACTSRRGKASVLNDAAQMAGGDVLCLCDANVMFEADALKILVARLNDPEVGAVSGDVRIASHESNFGQGEGAYYGVERSLQFAESQVGSLMGVDGGMYIMRRKLFQPLPPDTILDDLVLSLRVIRQKYRVVYEPAAIAHENGTPEASQEWRRRIRVAAGAAQCLARGDRPPISRPVELWQFLSHKALRWMTPLFLLALLASTAVLAPTSSFFLLVLVVQVAFYGTAAVATFSLLARQTRLAGTAFYFVMSNLAVAVGLVKGLLHLQPVTWVQAERSRVTMPHESCRLKSQL